VGIGAPEKDQSISDLGDESGEILDGAVDIAALLFEQVDPIAALLDGDPALLLAAIAHIVKVDHFANIGEAEANALATQDPGKPRPVTPGIDASEADAARCDQPLILVEAERARRDTELLAKLGDGIGRRAAVGVAEIGVKSGPRHGPPI
jgi:hypothetical protein